MTNNKQQTSVEWFYDEMIKFIKLRSKYSTDREILDQAKEMEKRQHWATWGNGVANAENEKLFKDYWNETYGGDK
jgi:hypothetical protein